MSMLVWVALRGCGVTGHHAPAAWGSRTISHPTALGGTRGEDSAPVLCSSAGDRERDHRLPAFTATSR